MQPDRPEHKKEWSRFGEKLKIAKGGSAPIEINHGIQACALSVSYSNLIPTSSQRFVLKSSVQKRQSWWTEILEILLQWFWSCSKIVRVYHNKSSAISSV